MFQADLSRNALARYSVDLRQFIDFRQSTLTNGLRIMAVPQEWQMVVTGGIVILAMLHEEADQRILAHRVRLPQHL